MKPVYQTLDYDWSVRKHDFGIADTPFGLCYFKVLQVKSDGRLFCRLRPSVTNSKKVFYSFNRSYINRVIELIPGRWKLI